VKIPLSWLREFVEITESTAELTSILDDLGLVVEGVEVIGEGLEDVLVARVEEIKPIKGADRIRLVVVDAGRGPEEIVCGATNFAVGNFVPLAPVGAVLPGGFAITERTMRGVVSHGMLCSARELGLSDDHEGLLLLDDVAGISIGEGLVEALDVVPDVVFDISVEGNRPDAWCVEGVARDLAARLGRPLRAPELAAPATRKESSEVAGAQIVATDLCGRLTLSVLENVVVGRSPAWIARRLTLARMRRVSNVVDASNLVMLELGQPTHPYDAARVAGRRLGVRRATPGETLVTLDGVARTLGVNGRGLGDTGDDLVIVDGEDVVIGLAGVMGGESSEITATTTEVFLEAAFFDPMTIARSSKRHALRSEASGRFERGVDPNLAVRAAARFVAVLRESVPDLLWRVPIDVSGDVPDLPTISLRAEDVERLLGSPISDDEISRLLRALDFSVTSAGEDLVVTPPSRRLDVRDGRAGRADVIEEVARLYGYQRLRRHQPTWPEPGGLNDRQQLRRRLRDVVVDLGLTEVWTPSLIADADFDLLYEGVARVRITNPLTAEESVLRPTMIAALVAVWLKNHERGMSELVVGELGVVFEDPSLGRPRATRGGAGGRVALQLPRENERVTIVLGRSRDDALSAVAWWHVIAERLGLDDVVVRSGHGAPRGFHPSRSGALIDRRTQAVLGYVGEVDPGLTEQIAGAPVRRLGLIDLDLDVLSDPALATRRAQSVTVPSRFPSAVVDLAFVTPRHVHAQDLAHALAHGDDLVERVTLFDVFEGSALPEGTRSLAYSVRLSSPERTLTDVEIVRVRETLLNVAARYDAVLR